MADKQLVAVRDGVLVKVGQAIVNLYRGGAVPQGADERHVALLKERELVVESDVPDAPVEDHGDAEAPADDTSGRRSASGSRAKAE